MPNRFANPGADRNDGGMANVPAPDVFPSHEMVRISWTDRMRGGRKGDSGRWASYTEPHTGEPQGFRMTWQLRALLPATFVLFLGLLVILAVTVTLSFSTGQRHAILTVAGFGAVAICAALLIGVALVVGRPMVELQEAISRVRTGDLDARVGFAQRNDELGELGTAFNEMVKEIAESREEIQRLHQTRMSRAEHLSTLGELAAGLAHEIRNPLAGISGVMEIVGRDLPENSPSRGVLKEVKFEVQHINRIVTDLLETARPKQPKLEIADLNATAEHAVLFARQQIGDKKVEIELAKAENLPHFQHDAGQIHQVLLNLLLNALQAIDAKGTVTVQVGRHDSFAAVSVIDTGRGISPEQLPHIFRPFYTTKAHGTGLGLSLARRIVEDHCGRMEVASQVGAGSRFTVLLPIRTAALSASVGA